MRTSRPARAFALATAIAAGFLAGPLAAASSATTAPLTFTASPSGNGTVCSAASPCSLQTAQQMVRQATSTAQSDIAVVLLGGTYRLTSTLSFDASKGDSAPAGHTVTYEAAPGAHPVISGGEQVTGWTQTTGGIWQANVPAGTDTRQLYVDGVRANRASGSVPVGLTQTATGYTASATTLAGWGNISNVEFVYNASWTQMRCGIASVSGTTVTMQEPCFQNVTLKQYGINAGTPSYIENAKELLTQPGQFYLNQSSHTIYYMPRAGQNPATADVEIPNLQTLVSGTGTEANPLTGLAFAGISFEYGGWTAPDGTDGFAEVQANMHLTGSGAYANQGTCTRFSTTNPGTCPYGAWTMTPGNVVFDHTSGLTITGSTFEHLGAAGLQLGQDADGSTIQGNEFTDISANGMEIGNGTDADPTDVALLPANNTIADNWVHNVAVEYTGGVGIFQGYTRNDVIEHNQINNVPYSGISSNWGWGRTATEATGNKILDNLVFDFLQQRIDGGGIYVLGIEGSSIASGLTISGNVVRYAAGAVGHAIYTDGGSEYITMTGNAMYGNNIPSMGGSYEGAGTPYGDFVFTGNYAENTTPDWPAGSPTNATISNNTQVSSDGTGVPASLLANAGLEPQYASLAAAPAGVAPVNLALGKPAQAQYIDGSTAQLQPGDQVSYATDGNPATAVQATGQFRWQLVVDLQQSTTLGSMTVSMPQAAFGTAFHVDASTDGSTWTTVGTVTNSGWGTIPVVFSSPLTTRYLRIVADLPNNGGQVGGQMAITEIGAYAPTATQPDLALNKPAQALFINGTQAQMQANSLPSYADDGNTSTYSQAAQQYRWIQQIDLQQPQSINVITLLQPTGTYTAYATAFHVDVSLDGSDYYTVARRTDAMGGITGIQLDSPVTARYIRVVADRPDDGGQTGGQMAISELSAYSQ
ncbi:discoidin domain-containing protein [Actinospica sp.]|uniref:discoidin domain-containing protein n=1 Tax=Actinospica sp. TaxID=1872142 RepID=UPI002B7B92E6|nr:discoidin domain-containing protein [Actinospica sp.]HWG26220.1 discoidin domain-containing protein [Actinospica sp.]